MSKHYYCKFFSALIFVVFTNLAVGATSPTISLNKAVQKALTQNPGLKAGQFVIKSAHGQIIQAALRPNPEIGFEFEKIGGNKEFSGTGQLENKVSLNQELETGGKRFYRIKAARIEKEIVLHEQLLNRRQLVEKVCSTWLQIYRLDKLVEIEKEFVELGEQNLRAISRKVSAGEVPAIDQIKAQVETATVKTELRKMQRQIETLKFELASFWGETASDFTITKDSLNFCQSIEGNEAQLEKVLDRLPEINIARKKNRLARADSELAKAQSRANISLEGGIVKERTEKKHHYFVGISFPLTIFNRNQGHRFSAKAQVKETDKNLEQSILTNRARLAELFKQTISVSEELATAHENLLPGANEAFYQTQNAYDQGERELFELIDARRVKLQAEKAVIQLEAEKNEYLLEICLKSGCHNFYSESANQLGVTNDN